MHITDIIKKPVVNTEKARLLMENNEFVFIVDKRANKIQIREAVEKLFNVKVLKVNTINVSGKEKRVGRNIGKTADWKKAIVSIDVNPGAEQSYLTKGGKVTKVTKKYNDSIAEVTGV